MASKSDSPPSPRSSTPDPSRRRPNTRSDDSDLVDGIKKLTVNDSAEKDEPKRLIEEINEKLRRSDDELKKSKEEIKKLEEKLQRSEDEKEELKKLKEEFELRSIEDAEELAYLVSEPTSSNSDDSDEAGPSEHNTSALAANESIHLVETAVTTILYCAYEKGGEKKKFKSGDNKRHAEECMLLASGEQLPVEIWLSRTPCYECAKLLIKKYEQEKKPKIHAKMVHVGKGNDGKIFKRGNEHQRGLAALIAMGFEVDIMGTDCYKSFIEKQEKRLESCKGYSKEYFRSLYSLYDEDDNIIIANVVVISGHDRFVILTLFSCPDVNKMEPIIESTMDNAKTQWHEAFNSYNMGSTGQEHWIVFDYKAKEMSNESINVDVQYCLKESDPPLLITEAAITKMKKDVTKIQKLYESLKWDRRGNCKQWS